MPSSGEIDVSTLVSQVVDYAIIALDVHGNIATWNAGAQRLKGYFADEAIGRHFSDFYTAEAKADGLPDRLLAQAEEFGRTQHSGWRCRADGSLFWGDVTITALRGDSGQLIGFGKVTRDRTEQHALEESLRQSEERFRLLVEQVCDYAIIALDADGVIQTWNVGAERVKGYTPGEAIGKHFSMFYPDDDRADGLPEHLLEQARADGSVEHTGWRIRKDGTRFWGDVIITALMNPNGELNGYAKVTRDMTAHHQFERAREKFFTTFVHDFQTPITAIGGFARLLKSSDAEAKDKLTVRIENLAERLSNMASDLIDHSRAVADEGSDRIELLDAREVMVGTAYDLPPELGPGRVEPPPSSGTIVAERAAVIRIIQNLLTNALKYSPSSSPVRTEVRIEDSWTVLVVTDGGRGIHEDDLASIFDDFQRGRLSGVDGGSGVGLSSVRSLALSQGGSVWIESELGVGTSVFVQLPGGDPT